MTEGLFAAIITATAVIIIAVVNRQGNRSHNEHDKTMMTLDRIEDKVDDLGTKVDGHLGWHDGIEGK